MSQGKKGTFSICSIDGCDRRVKARSLCGMHLQRKSKHGDPLKRLRKANGEGHVRRDGYSVTQSAGVEKLAHVLVAERALGRPLPAGAQVHHVDEDRQHNEPTNLVICPSNAYHKIIHQRMRALAACGHADWRKCQFCQQYSDRGEMKHRAAGSYCHVECERADARQRYAEKRNENAVHIS